MGCSARPSAGPSNGACPAGRVPACVHAPWVPCAHRPQRGPSPQQRTRAPGLPSPRSHALLTSSPWEPPSKWPARLTPPFASPPFLGVSSFGEVRNIALQSAPGGSGLRFAFVELPASAAESALEDLDGLTGGPGGRGRKGAALGSWPAIEPACRFSGRVWQRVLARRQPQLPGAAWPAGLALLRRVPAMKCISLGLLLMAQDAISLVSQPAAC